MTYSFKGNRYSRKEMLAVINQYLTPFNQGKGSERVKIALNFIDGERILDIGCGIGIFVQLISSKHNKNVVGIDMLQSNIDIANELLKKEKMSFIKMNAEKIDFPENSFDCITLLEVIEHLNNPTKVLADCNKILKPNGEIIVSTPNSASFYNVFHTLIRTRNDLKRLETEKRGLGTETDHLFLWDLYTLYRLLNKCGFEYVSHKYCDGTFSKLPLNLKRFSKTIIVKFKKTS